MKFTYAGLFLIASLVLSSFFRHDWEFAFIGLATIIGYLFGTVTSLRNDLRTLRDVVTEDLALRKPASSQTTEPKQSQAPTENSDAQTSTEGMNEAQAQYVNESISQQQQEYLDLVAQSELSGIESNSGTKHQSSTVPISDSVVLAEDATSPTSKSFNSPAWKEKPKAEDSVFDKLTAKVKDYFTGGNIFVRIGIIILFFGVSFLLKYVSDRGFFPIEYRLIGVVIGAIALLGLGWCLRHKNETYALLLQGAGIGILYLDIFAAFSMYQLIVPTLAFVLLFVVSMLSAALAVLQNSKSLAVLGFSGGFLAPILASNGTIDHVSIFSYYVVLNIAIVAIAWFKAWRPLNLLGFAFTFIIGTAWGVFRYDHSKFGTTEPFLIIFFLFYVIIAVLFALRQPPKLRGYVDGTLLFGVPLAASALQYALVKDFEYGVSISSFAMGLFYLVLSWFVWNRNGVGLKLLAEAFLALGIIFASMAIPFALAPTQTAAAWALEGAGLLWLGSRQNRLSVRAFGLILQFGAGFIFLARFNHIADLKPFINGHFISSMMLAVAGIISARLLSSEFKGCKIWEKGSSPIVLGWAMIWLFGGFIFQLFTHYELQWMTSNILILSAVVSLGFTLAAKRYTPQWEDAWYLASGLFGLVLLLGIAQVGMTSFQSVYHPSQFNGWIAWPIVFAVFYFHLFQLQKHNVFPKAQPIFHSVILVSLIALITVEGAWWLSKQLSYSSAWIKLWYAIPAILTLWMIIKAKFWPFSAHEKTYRQQTGLVFAIYLALWALMALLSKGESDPLPWIPVLNPMDITVVIIFISLFKWWQTSDLSNQAIFDNQTQKSNAFNQRTLIIGFAALVFLWLNFTLFRVAHHWFGIPFQMDVLFNSTWVQTAVSILWALSGVLLTLYSSRKNIRVLWVTGAVLLGLVVVKLFVIDLAALGSLGRIVSFLVVGTLLTSIGYFAPLPDKSDTASELETDVDSSPTEEKLDA